MRDIQSILNGYNAPKQKKRGGERGTLISYMAKKMKWTDKGMAMTVGHLKELQDLYYLKSDCDQAEARGVAWPAAFREALHLSKKYKTYQKNTPKD